MSGLATVTRLPQVAPWHHVGVTMDITLDKIGSFKRSIRNWVLWTCKVDEKQINQRSTLRIMEVLQNDHRDQNRHQIKWGPNPRINNRGEIQIVTTVQMQHVCRWVLSLAPCYFGKMQKQVRQGDQPWYPIQDRSFVAHGRSRMPCAPAVLEGERKKERKRRSFTSI